ncbi:MAG: GalNAc-alpha-(1-_4)-GalNAc-alpha-(1-_3)-diNAcBac-PP-undecaprenol alpha-1,4-N-acetyl-D-galactosaminyltransferase [Deltaproteobacteria bacterium ADurb.BinA179]|nr:MAG: GalNAc-alpha-(1->4)-GalNAc-alpha-(1->3)-diNAcBac-PP-undecaprenol alpha-1,4-N-acetyl-D-galactosaminyltransferase [Deltaproteobacteria bacterium ADurb.BinA179]
MNLWRGWNASSAPWGAVPDLMKIALIIGTLRGGGAERIMSGMANHWLSQGHAVTLITHDAQERDSYPLEPGANRIGLDLTGPTQGPLQTLGQRVRRITVPRGIIRTLRPDVVISFTYMTSCETIIALWDTGIPLIVSERNNPVAQRIPTFWGVLRTLLYPRSRAVVMQTEKAAAWARRYVDKGRVHVIPNFVEAPTPSPGLCPIDLPGTRHLVAAAGRLTHQKGFDLLVEAFSRAAGDRSDWSLVILGEGEDRRLLQDLISRLSLDDRVLLPGRIQNLEPVLRRSDIFVLSSRYEGFPNVLMEAMALGLPVISTDCPYGPGDIIRHGHDGILVPNQDVQALANAMGALIEDEGERRRLAAQSASVLDRFGKDAIMHQWEKLIESAVGRHS